jgi:hypothetical protein
MNGSQEARLVKFIFSEAVTLLNNEILRVSDVECQLL